MLLSFQGLYQIAADNLELTGTANRAAVVVISQICLYYTNILQKVKITELTSFTVHFRLLFAAIQTLECPTSLSSKVVWLVR